MPLPLLLCRVLLLDPPGLWHYPLLPCLSGLQTAILLPAFLLVPGQAEGGVPGPDPRVTEVLDPRPCLGCLQYLMCCLFLLLQLLLPILLVCLFLLFRLLCLSPLLQLLLRIRFCLSLGSLLPWCTLSGLVAPLRPCLQMLPELRRYLLLLFTLSPLLYCPLLLLALVTPRLLLLHLQVRLCCLLRSLLLTSTPAS